MPQLMLLSTAALLGLAVGSFLNVVIHRVPRGESLVRPGSHCPQCGNEVRHRHNVPVLGWLLLRGKCHDCGKPIPVRYPLVEAGTAALFVAVAAHFGLSWELPAYLYLAAIAVALTVIDLDTQRLPDAIVLPSYSVGLALLMLPMIAENGWDAGTRALLAAGATIAFFYLVWFVHPRGMGFGDVKLSLLIGLYLGFLGWKVLAVGAFAGFVLGGFVGALLLAAGRAKFRKTKIPYGPYMLAGAFLAVFAGAPIADWYLGLINPTAA